MIRYFQTSWCLKVSLALRWFHRTPQKTAGNIEFLVFIIPFISLNIFSVFTGIFPTRIIFCATNRKKEVWLRWRKYQWIRDVSSHSHSQLGFSQQKWILLSSSFDFSFNSTARSAQTVRSSSNSSDLPWHDIRMRFFVFPTNRTARQAKSFIGLVSGSLFWLS